MTNTPIKELEVGGWFYAALEMSNELLLVTVSFTGIIGYNPVNDF